MNITDSDKIAVLKTLYSQVQSTALKIRDDIVKLTSAVGALFVALNGWLLTSKQVLTMQQKIGLTVGVVIVLFFSSIVCFRFYKEFKAVCLLIVRTETGLGVYKRGLYVPEETLYPEEYQELPKQDYKYGKHILMGPTAIMGTFALFSVLVIWFA